MAFGIGRSQRVIHLTTSGSFGRGVSESDYVRDSFCTRLISDHVMQNLLLSSLLSNTLIRETYQFLPCL